MVELTDLELQLIQEIAGQRPRSSWGAWVGACLESLRGRDLVDRSGNLTEAGWRTVMIDWMPGNKAPEDGSSFLAVINYALNSPLVIRHLHHGRFVSDWPDGEHERYFERREILWWRPFPPTPREGSLRSRADGIYVSPNDGDLLNPHFEAPRKCHDWRNHLGSRTKELWFTFTDEQRRSLAQDADDRAGNEDWE